MTSAIVVGSGPNGLAAALTLASEGIEVTVLEAADTLGGGTRTSELTASRPAPRRVLGRSPPGRRHGVHPPLRPRRARADVALAGGSVRPPARRRRRRRGLPVGASDRGRRSDMTAGAWRSVFAPLAERFHDITADFMRPMLHMPEHPIDLTRFGLYSALPAAVLARRWSTEEARALFAGVAAHAFRPFGSPMSSAIGVTLGTAAHRYGWPVAEGGSGSISRAMIALLEDAGARFETGVRVDSLAELGSADIVMLDVAPAAAARIAGDRMPRRIARALTRYRHGPGDLQGRLRDRGRSPVGLRARRGGPAPCTSAGASRKSPPARNSSTPGGCPRRRTCSSASSTSPTHRARTATCTPCTPTPTSPPATPATPPRRSRPRSNGSPPGSATASSPDTSDRSHRCEAHNANYVGGDVVTGSNDPLQMVFRPRVALDPYTHRHPRRVHLLRGHPTRRRRPRHVRLQRRTVGTEADRPRPSHADCSGRKPPGGRPGGDDSGHPVATDVARRVGGR